MKKVLGVLFGLTALVVVGVVGVFAFSNMSAGPVSDVAKDVKAAATNTLLDVSDVKGQVQSTLEEHRDDIAALTGFSADQIDTALANLDIQSWQATPLPSDAVETGTVNSSYAGFDGTITTYTDPTYITLETYGQTVTLAVPASAQEYLPYLALAS